MTRDVTPAVFIDADATGIARSRGPDFPPGRNNRVFGAQPRRCAWARPLLGFVPVRSCTRTTLMPYGSAHRYRTNVPTPRLDAWRPSRVPVTLYRLQLSSRFTFADVRAVVGYLHALGVTDCYLSPILMARPRSTHGYDISDHTRLNPELGGEAALRGLVADARAAATWAWSSTSCPTTWASDPERNRWWRDVLENGPALALRALLRHRLDAGQARSSRARCCCRSSATSTATSWSAAS